MRSFLLKQATMPAENFDPLSKRPNNVYQSRLAMQHRHWNEMVVGVHGLFFHTEDGLNWLVLVLSTVRPSFPSGINDRTGHVITQLSLIRCFSTCSSHIANKIYFSSSVLQYSTVDSLPSPAQCWGPLASPAMGHWGTYPPRLTMI